MELKTNQIRTDGGTQARAQLDSEAVQEYRDILKENGTTWPFPPVVVFHDGSEYWLADGFHRIAAARQHGRFVIEADVRQGQQRDAILFAAGANADHGLKRTAEDKRRAVMRLLEDAEWGQWADREIARRCKVSPTFVGGLRVTVHVDSEEEERTYKTKHGTQAVMKTAAIGKTAAEKEPESESEFLSVDDLKEKARKWLKLNPEGGLSAFIHFLDIGGKPYVLHQASLAFNDQKSSQSPWRVVNGEQGSTIRRKLELYARSRPTTYDAFIFSLADEEASGHGYLIEQAAEAMNTTARIIREQARILSHAIVETEKEEDSSGIVSSVDIETFAYEWLRDYEDKKGRRWHDLEDGQILHANSPCYQAFARQYSAPKALIKLHLTNALNRLQGVDESDLADQDTLPGRATATEAAEIEEMLVEPDPRLQYLKSSLAIIDQMRVGMDATAEHDLFFALNNIALAMYKAIDILK